MARLTYSISSRVLVVERAGFGSIAEADQCRAVASSAGQTWEEYKASKLLDLSAKLTGNPGLANSPMPSRVIAAARSGDNDWTRLNAPAKGKHGVTGHVHGGAIKPGYYVVGLPGSRHPDMGKLRERWIPVFFVPTRKLIYIHPGSLSEGCIVVTEMEKYFQIFQIVLDDGGGTLQVLPKGRIFTFSPGAQSLIQKSTIESPTGGGNSAVDTEKEVTCSHDGLIVSCSHSRGYRLALPDASLPPGSGPAAFEVVAGPKKKLDSITVETKVTKGPCASHKRLLKISGHGNIKLKSESQTKQTLDVSASDDYAATRVLANPMKYLWPSQARTRDYTVEVKSCDKRKNQSAVIRVYPDIKWEAGIGIKWEDKTKAGVDAAGTLKRKSSSGFAVDGNIKVTTDGDEPIEVKVEFERKLKETLKVLNTTKEIVDYVSGSLDKVCGDALSKKRSTEFTMTWPSIRLQGDWGYEEIHGTGAVGYGYGVRVAFDPLFEIKVEENILPFLLNWITTSAGAPGLGAFLNTILNHEYDGKRLAFENEAGIYLAMSGKISGEIGGSRRAGKEVKQANEAKTEVKAEIEASVRGAIKGEAKVKGKILCVEAGGGIEMGAKSSITGSYASGNDLHGPFYEGEIAWNGVKVWYYRFAYVHGDICALEEEPKEVVAGRSSKKSGEEKSLTVGPEAKNKVWDDKPIIEGHSWGTDGRVPVIHH
jgi:hypothetical protein